MNMQWVKNRKYQAFLAIAVLIVLNLWRWWPEGSSGHTAGRAVRQSGAGFTVEDFNVRVIPDSIHTAMHRDLFSPKRIEQAMIKSTQKLPKPPEKTPEELAVEVAQAELAQYRCVGVSIRMGRFQAFIIRGGQTYLVSPGDKLGDRFVVDKISTDSVMLSDPETGVGGQISVSGR